MPVVTSSFVEELGLQWSDPIASSGPFPFRPPCGPSPLPHRRLELVLPEASQGPEWEQEGRSWKSLLKTAGGFGVTRADTLNNLPVKRKKKPST